MHCPSLSGWSMRWRWCKGTKEHKRWRELDLVQPTIWCRQGNITRQGSTKREALTPIMVADWFLVYGQARSCSGGRKIECGLQKGWGDNLHPVFITGLGHLEPKQLGESAERSHSLLISTPPLDFVCWNLWIIHHQFRCLELCSGLNLETFTFFFALRSRACLFAGWAESKQTKEMSKGTEQGWDLLLEEERTHLGTSRWGVETEAAVCSLVGNATAWCLLNRTNSGEAITGAASNTHGLSQHVWPA